jgi:precorrin-6B methylase 1
MRTYTLHYLFNGEPRTHAFELKQPHLPLHEAAMHLLQLHFGDSENSLIMPNAEATPEEIAKQAERVGLTRIEVVDQLA